MLNIKDLHNYIDFWKLKIINKLKIPHKGYIYLAGLKIHFGSIRHLLMVYNEVFIKKCYDCEISENPTIIDAGANIGLSTIFFKLKYPNAKILAFEPHPETFQKLKKNVEGNNLKNVEIYNVALGMEEKMIKFFGSSDMPTADIGMSSIKQHVEYFHSKKGDTIEIDVPCKKLSTFINMDIDLLKLDVEGSENEVFIDLSDKLSIIENIVMEYHYHFTYSNNPLSKIIHLMEKNSHLYKIFPNSDSMKLEKEATYTIKSKKDVIENK